MYGCSSAAAVFATSKICGAVATAPDVGTSAPMTSYCVVPPVYCSHVTNQFAPSDAAAVWYTFVWFGAIVIGAASSGWPSPSRRTPYTPGPWYVSTYETAHVTKNP